MRLTRNPLPSRLRSPIKNSNIIYIKFLFKYAYREFDHPIHRTY
jgi:hypothetical protein